MPIYEYQCRACGHQFEYLALPSSSQPECPSCHDRDLQKMISLCAVRVLARRISALNVRNIPRSTARNSTKNTRHFTSTTTSSSFSPGVACHTHANTLWIKDAALAQSQHPARLQCSRV